MIPNVKHFDGFDIKYGPLWCSYGSSTHDVDLNWFLEYVLDDSPNVDKIPWGMMMLLQHFIGDALPHA